MPFPRNLRYNFSIPAGTRIIELDPSVFWAKVIVRHDWHDDTERERTRRFIRLREILAANFQNIQYFEVGAIEVTLYYIGRKHEAIRGIRTMAVRT